jgi:hypothetical protein
MRIRFSTELSKRLLWVSGATVVLMVFLGMGNNPAPVSIGYEVVTATSATNTDDSKNQVATCPSGKKVLGGGGGNGGNDAARVAIKFSGPVAGNEGWVVRALETQPDTFTQWSVTVFAICATVK